MKLCFLIPVYNHKEVLGLILDRLAAFHLPCILVDDGSDRDCEQEILKQAASRDWVKTFRLPENQGKGAAVYRGFVEAAKLGYTHAFQIDADGQHNLDDVERFIHSAEQQPDALIMGQALYDESVPKSRLYGRYITHFWVWIETLSFEIRDSMCGFRIYPLAPSLRACRDGHIGLRMNFDIEIVVRLAWAGVPMHSIPTLVRYPLDGISHFHLFRDNVQISLKHTQLVCEMLIRLPVLLWRRSRLLWLRGRREARS